MATTAREMLPAIGQTVSVRSDIGEVHCKVLDVKSAYGRNRLLIVPIAGTGETWVDITRVSKIEQTRPVNGQKELL